MLDTLPEEVVERMKFLEEIDARDHENGEDGTARRERLRQVPPSIGRFLALMLMVAPEGQCIEIGTSAGYSATWLGLACQRVGRSLTTFELQKEKAAMAEDTFRLTGLTSVVDLVCGDARHFLDDHDDIAFCFLDAEKEAYEDCYELVVPKMVPGGILVADNAISHRSALRPVIDRALADPRVYAQVLPIGKGELVCRRM